MVARDLNSWSRLERSGGQRTMSSLSAVNIESLCRNPRAEPVLKRRAMSQSHLQLRRVAGRGLDSCRSAACLSNRFMPEYIQVYLRAYRYKGGDDIAQSFRKHVQHTWEIVLASCCMSDLGR